MAVWNNTTIGLSADIDSKLNEITDNLQFSDAQAAFKFCFSIEYAWASEHDQLRNYRETDAKKSRTTKWGIAGFDPDQTFGDLADISVPTEFGGDFGKFVEVLGDAGVERVYDLVDKHDIYSISEIFESIKLK